MAIHIFLLSLTLSISISPRPSSVRPSLFICRSPYYLSVFWVGLPSTTLWPCFQATLTLTLPLSMASNNNLINRLLFELQVSSSNPKFGEVYRTSNGPPCWPFLNWNLSWYIFPRNSSKRQEIGDRKPHIIPTMTFLIGWSFWGAWCANCRSPRKRRKICTTPSFAIATLMVDFVGVVRGFRSLKTASEFASFVVLNCEPGMDGWGGKEIHVGKAHCLSISVSVRELLLVPMLRRLCRAPVLARLCLKC